jgi:hypothetical protein
MWDWDRDQIEIVNSLIFKVNFSLIINCSRTLLIKIPLYLFQYILIVQGGFT